MLLPNRKIVVLIALLLLNPLIVYPTDVYIYSHSPTVQHTKKLYNDSSYKTKLRQHYLRQKHQHQHQRRRLKLNSYPNHATKNTYHGLIKQHYRHHYRHPAIEHGYYDYARQRYRRDQQKQYHQSVR